MKIQLIKLTDKFILVSDEEIKEKEWFIDMRDFPDVYDEDLYCAGSGGSVEFANTIGKKILAGIPELPQIDFSLLSEEDCKRIGWVNVEKLAIFNTDNYVGHQQKQEKERKICFNSFIDGFKAAQSLNKEFSLEDMRKLASAAFTVKSHNETLIEDFDKWFDKRIQSLQQTIWDVEVEMDSIKLADILTNCNNWEVQPKITNKAIKITKIL